MRGDMRGWMPGAMAIALALTGVMAMLATPAGAMPVARGIVELGVDHFDPGAFGLSVLSPGTTFVGRIGLAVGGGGTPDPSTRPATLDDFELTIGNASWDETMPHSDVMVRVVKGLLVGIEVFITETRPEHPDLLFHLPASPGTWEALDLVDGVDHGRIGGTYRLLARVPEPGALVLLAAGLMGLAGAIRWRSPRG